MQFAVSDKVLKGVAAGLAAIAILGLWLGFSGGQGGRSATVRTASQPVPPDGMAQALPIIEEPVAPAAKPAEKTEEQLAAEEKAAEEKAAAAKAAAEKAAQAKAATNAAPPAPIVAPPPPPPPAPEEPPPADEPPPF